MSNLTHDSGNKRKSLGRGLGSLIKEASTDSLTSLAPSSQPEMGAGGTQDPGVVVAKEEKVALTEQPLQSQAQPSPGVPPESRVWNIPIEKLHPSQFQPRQNFDAEKLEELANSIRGQGILQPIVARKLSEGAFEIIAGERRWRAAQLAGLRDVPVILKTLSNKDTLELAIIENVQREDLNPIEEAEAYLRLSQEFGLNHQQIADRVGKDRATVANSLRLLALPSQVRSMVLEGSISQGHAKVILSLSESQKMVQVAKKAQEEGLSVRQLEKVVQAFKNLAQDKPQSPEVALADKMAVQLADELQKNLGTKVTIDYRQGKGKVTIQFYSDEELNSIAERLRL